MGFSESNTQKKKTLDQVNMKKFIFPDFGKIYY